MEPPGNADPLQADQMEAAEADIAKLRDTLSAAGRGEVSATEVKQAVQRYIGEHGPTLQAAAAAIGEETRQQTLSELYKWREQLKAQVAARESAQEGPRAAEWTKSGASRDFTG